MTIDLKKLINIMLEITEAGCVALALIFLFLCKTLIAIALILIAIYLSHNKLGE